MITARPIVWSYPRQTRMDNEPMYPYFIYRFFSARLQNTVACYRQSVRPSDGWSVSHKRLKLLWNWNLHHTVLRY